MKHIMKVIKDKNKNNSKCRSLGVSYLYVLLWSIVALFIVEGLSLVISHKAPPYEYIKCFKEVYLQDKLGYDVSYTQAIRHCSTEEG